MIKVYIASPYTIGDVAVNVRCQIDAANELMHLGYSPYVPLLCHFQHMVHPRVYEDWMRHTSDWLHYCDAVLRLPGMSKGADMEVYLARSLDISVFASINELVANMPSERIQYDRSQVNPCKG